MYRSGKGVWPFYCCDPGWSVYQCIERYIIFSRKQYKGDDDDDVYCIGSSQEPPPRPEHKCGGKPVFLVPVLYKKNMKRRI